MLIAAEKIEAWNLAVEKCGYHEVYHSAEYHQLESILGTGEPFLFFFGYEDGFAALPFIKRPLCKVKGLEDSPYFDACSAYGYPGPISSVDESDPSSPTFSRLFQEVLTQILDQHSIISLFCRFNPISPKTWLLNDICDIKPMGRTVAIDLDLSEKDQLMQMSNSRKRNIRIARMKGIVIEEDIGLQNIDLFMKIYYETMERAGAKPYYYFPEEYFYFLRDKMNRSVKLFFAKIADEIIGAEIFLISNKVIQFHLGGTRTEYLKFKTSELIIDEVRLWGKRKGYSWLHLGGGYQSNEDPLFDFKARFSKIRFVYHTGRAILNPEIYVSSNQQREARLPSNGFDVTQSHYFPQYRTEIE